MRWLKLSLLLALLAGCATPMAKSPPVAHPRAVQTPPLPQAIASKVPAFSPERELRTLLQQQAPKGLFLRWDFDFQSGPGPVWFEVWSSTNLARIAWAGGTNVPSGFSPWTNTTVTNIPLAATEMQRHFIVRAANAAGVSDWAGR